MKHRDANEIEASLVGSDSTEKGTGMNDHTHASRGSRWLAYMASAVLVAALLIAAKLSIEASPMGPKIESRTQELLSAAFRNFRPEGLNVTLLDISHLALGGEDPSSERIIPTSRKHLLEILKALAPLRPRAVGIDIDFSPANNWWVDDGDPEFFKQCLEFSSNSAPLVLGVFRGMQGDRQGWLGAPEFAPLAGGIWLPSGGLERAPIWTKAPQAEDRLPSFAAALASAVRPNADLSEDKTGWLRRFRQRHSSEWDGLQIGEVLTDYSIAAQASHQVIKISSADQLYRYRSSIRGKVVILGALERALAVDKFAVPGQSEEVPGVVVHAAVLHSLVNEPIYELSHGARIVLDLLFSIAFLSAVPLLTWRSRRSPTAPALISAERRARAWLVLAVLVSGSLLVFFARILWLDFILVALCLIVHPMASAALHRFLHRARRTVRSAT